MTQTPPLKPGALLTSPKLQDSLTASRRADPVRSEAGEQPGETPRLLGQRHSGTQASATLMHDGAAAELECAETERHVLRGLGGTQTTRLVVGRTAPPVQWPTDNFPRLQPSQSAD